MTASLLRSSHAIESEPVAVASGHSDVASSTILFVLPWSVEAIGGVNQVVINLIRQTEKGGLFRGLLLENRCGSFESSVAFGGGIPTIHLELRCPTVLLRFLAALPATLWRLYRLLTKHRVAVVNVHYPSPAALHFCILRMLRIYRGKVILSVHGQDVATAAQTAGFSRFCWNSLFRCADTVVVCSAAMAGEVAAFDPQAAKRVVVIHNGVDHENLEDQRDRDFSVPELAGAPYVLSIGTFEHKKGHDVLIDAFARIAPEFPRHRLVLVGRSGRTVSDLRRQIAQGGLEGRVLIYENVPHRNVPAFIERASLFCLPSRVEPFGIVLLEAGVFGIPIVASRVGGVVEVMEDGVHGCLVEPDEVEPLAAALRQQLLDREQGFRCALRFKRRVLQEFTWDKAFKQYLKLL